MPPRSTSIRLALLLAGAVAAGAVVALASRGGDPKPPPPVPAARVRAALGAPQAGTGAWGVVQLDQSVVPRLSLRRFGLPAGSIRGRYWVADAAHWRLELQGTGHDWQVVRDGPELAAYWDGSQTRAVLAVAALPRAVSAIGPVRVEPVARPVVAAGRTAHVVVYRPADAGTLVARIELTADTETGVPLAVRVWAVGRDTPVLDLRATAFHRARVSLSRVRLDPPATATSVPLDTLLALGERSGAARVVGDGWARALRLPLDGAPEGLVRLLGAASGPDATGVRAGLQTPLLSTLVVGHVIPPALLVGPVRPEVLRELARG